MSDTTYMDDPADEARSIFKQRHDELEQERRELTAQLAENSAALLRLEADWYKYVPPAGQGNNQ